MCVCVWFFFSPDLARVSVRAVQADVSGACESREPREPRAPREATPSSSTAAW